MQYSNDLFKPETLQVHENGNLLGYFDKDRQEAQNLAGEKKFCKTDIEVREFLLRSFEKGRKFDPKNPNKAQMKLF